VNPQDADTGSLDNGLTPHYIIVPYDAGRLLAHTSPFGTSPENSIGKQSHREEIDTALRPLRPFEIETANTPSGDGTILTAAGNGS
jgi:hypothetical protein